MKLFRVIFLCLISFSFFSELDAEEILSWGDCLLEAQKNNPDLISAAASISQKQAAKTIAGSGLYPRVDLSAAASSSKSEPASASDSYSYAVTGKQLLFDGFKTINKVGSASENIKVAQEGYRYTSGDVRFRLRAAFVNLLKAQELINVAEEIVRIRRSSLELITLRYLSGFEHKGALLTAEANLRQAKFELSQSRRNAEFLQRQLTKEMGRKIFAPVTVRGDFSVRTDISERPEFERLAKEHPSVLQGAAKKNAAFLDLRSAYGEFIPQVSANTSVGKRGSHLFPENDQWSLGLTFSLPLLEGGLRHAQVAQAQAVYAQLIADEQSTLDAISVHLHDAWMALEDALENVEVQDKILIAAKERLKIAEAQYSTGFINFDNWIIIENDLVKAKKTYLEAEANALLVEASWVLAKGETLEYAQ